MTEIEDIVKRCQFLRWNQSTQMFEAGDEEAPMPYWTSKRLSGESWYEVEMRGASLLGKWKVAGPTHKSAASAREWIRAEKQRDRKYRSKWLYRIIRKEIAE